MTELLATLASIALVDSLSVVPMAVVPLLLLLGGKRPAAGSFAFIGGILLTYLPFGLLLLFGLDSLFDEMARRFSEWWAREPDFGEVVLEIAIGLAMVIFGHRLCNRGKVKNQEEKRADMTPGQAFSLAAALNLSGLWGALPYFAAIAQILKEDLSPAGMVGALIFYNLVFALPLITLPLLHLFLGRRAERWFEAMSRFIARWGGRVLVTLLIGLGFLLTVDGIGWLLGTPLLLSAARN